MRGRSWDRWNAALVCALGVLLPAAKVDAQAVDVSYDNVPLRAALTDFAVAHDIDLVYASRQVDGKSTSCRYAGADIEAALECVLRSNGLRAERLRRRQYVVAYRLSTDPGESEVSTRSVLRGYVFDGNSGEALPDASVYVPALGLGAVTNKAGYFAVAELPVVPYRVRVSFLGYALMDTVLSPQEDLRLLALYSEALTTEEVVIQSEHLDQQAVDPGVTPVPVSTLAALPGAPGEADLLQAMRWMPGVEKARSGDGGLIVRGGEPDQVLYLVDGAPVYHTWHVAGLLSVFQPEAFKNVRLYQGTFPAEYGGRLSAVMEAELKDGNQERITGLAAAGLISGRALLEGPIGHNLSFMVAGRRSYLDRIVGTEHPVRNPTQVDTMRTGAFLSDLGGKVTWRPSHRHRLSVGIYSNTDVIDLRLPFDLALGLGSIFDVGAGLNPSSLIFEMDTRWRNRLFSTRYQFLFQDRLFVTATGYVTAYRARERFYVRPVESLSVASEYRVRISDLGLKLDVDYYPSATHHLRMGLRAVGRDFFSSLDASILRSANSFERRLEESSLDVLELVAYGQDTWQPSTRMQIQPGLRLSMLGTGAVRLDPRLGIRYAFDRWVLRSFAGLNVQYVHRIRDRHSFLYDLVSQRWVPASRSVGPSRAAHAAVGGEIRAGSAVTISSEAYLHSVEGLLLPRDEDQTKDGLEGPGVALGAILGQYTRGRALAYGLDSKVMVQRAAYLGWVSYSFGRSRSRAPELGEERLRPARLDVPHWLRMAVQRTTSHWVVGLSGLLRSGYPITVPEAHYAIGDPLDPEPHRLLFYPRINNGRLPLYKSFAAQVAYRWSYGSLDWEARVQMSNVTFARNVTDRIYELNRNDPVVSRVRKGLPAYPLAEVVLTF